MGSCKKTLRNLMVCREHPDEPVLEDYHAGDVLCSLCGLVIGDRVIDVGSEWRDFADQQGDSKSRVGASENPMLEGSVASTVVANTPKTFKNEFGQPAYRTRYDVSKTDRRLVSAFTELSQMADRLHLPSKLVEQANSIFKKFHDLKTMKMSKFNAVVSACLYAACRQDGSPRTFKEICAVSKCSLREISQMYKLVMRSLDSSSSSVITTDDFMSRFCARLQLSKSEQKIASHIAKRAAEIEFESSRNPVSIAAGAIFLATQLYNDSKKTIKDICEITGVAEGTVRVVYKGICARAAELFPDDVQLPAPIDCLPPN